jgi:hypothetical protein
MDKHGHIIPLIVDRRTWQGLESEANLLARVFDHHFSPEDVARVRVKLGSRARSLPRRRARS